jgi:hypothetical protein
LTIIETISADGNTIPPVAIVQGKQHMESWYKDLKVTGMRVLLSETGYTNSELCLHYLDHLKEHLDFTRPKVLLMDQHGSHMDPLFTLKAHEYQIYPYAFPGHLTHVLQPLDVGVFQAYKHWHRKAVQSAIRSLDIEYTIASFFRDLKDIRTDTFKKSTIQGAFRKTGIWPINTDTAIQKMKVYQPPEPPQELPGLYNTPRKFSDAKTSLTQLQQDLEHKDLSSPTQGRISSVVKGTSSLLEYSALVKLQLEQSRAQAKAQQLKKTRSRRKLQKSGVLTVEQAHAQIAEKEAQEKAIKEKKRQSLLRRTTNKIKNEYKDRGVIARREERFRKQKVKELRSSIVGIGNSLIPPELLEPIPDPEKDLTKELLDLLVKEALISFPEFSGVVISDSTISLDQNLDPALLDLDPIALQKDYVSLLGSSDNEEDEEEVQFSCY